MSAVNGRWITFVMVPKPCDGLFRYRIVLVAPAIVIEDSELFFCHHKARWLCSNLSPDVGDVPFKDCGHCSGNLPILILLRCLQSLGHCELGRC